MNVTELLALEPGVNLTVFTDTFSLKGNLLVNLEGDATSAWLFSEEGSMLSINPEADEMMLFKAMESELEVDDDIVVESGKDYEFSYEDRGEVESVDGLAPYDEAEELEFTDYEAADGSRIRVITNTFNGEQKAFIGNVVTEDDVIVNE